MGHLPSWERPHAGEVPFYSFYHFTLFTHLQFYLPSPSGGDLSSRAGSPEGTQHPRSGSLCPVPPLPFRARQPHSPEGYSSTCKHSYKFHVIHLFKDKNLQTYCTRPRAPKGDIPHLGVGVTLQGKAVVGRATLPKGESTAPRWRNPEVS